MNKIGDLQKQVEELEKRVYSLETTLLNLQNEQVIIDINGKIERITYSIDSMYGFVTWNEFEKYRPVLEEITTMSKL